MFRVLLFFFPPRIKMWMLSNNLYFPKLHFFLSVQSFSMTLVLLQHCSCLGVLRGPEVNVTGDRQCPPGFLVQFSPVEVQPPAQQAGFSCMSGCSWYGTTTWHSLSAQSVRFNGGYSCSASVQDHQSTLLHPYFWSLLPTVSVVLKSSHPDPSAGASFLHALFAKSR